MNLKLLVGILLFIVGLITAAVGITGVGLESRPDVTLQADQNEATREQGWSNVAIPVIAGLSLGVGGLLIGLSIGNWKHPRTTHAPGDEIVDPEGYHKMKHV
jgi:hypothetical protein